MCLQLLFNMNIWNSEIKIPKLVVVNILHIAVLYTRITWSYLVESILLNLFALQNMCVSLSFGISNNIFVCLHVQDQFIWVGFS